MLFCELLFLSSGPPQTIGNFVDFAIVGRKCLCVSGKVVLWSKRCGIIILVPMFYLTSSSVGRLDRRVSVVVVVRRRPSSSVQRPSSVVRSPSSSSSSVVRRPSASIYQVVCLFSRYVYRYKSPPPIYKYLGFLF